VEAFSSGGLVGVECGSPGTELVQANVASSKSRRVGGGRQKAKGMTKKDLDDT
jgi:hypothetical protein